MQENNNKSDLLKNVSIFSTLKEKEIEIVAQYSDYDSFKNGDIIFTQGSSAEELFIIKTGEVAIKKTTDSKRDVELARFISGECFGEMDLLDVAPRSENAVAEKECVLLRFPKKGVLFEDVLYKHPELSASILSKLLAQVAGRIRSTNKLISEKAPWIESLRKQLLSDKLTGLYNRAFLEEDFVSNFNQYGEEFCLIMVKPDNFKQINDTFGHDAGDKVIRLLADTLRRSIDEADIPVRYRGNEFGAVSPNTNLAKAVQKAEGILTQVRNLDLSQSLNGTIPMSASIGIAAFPAHVKTGKKMIDLAYERLYQARDTGGDRIICE